MAIIEKDIWLEVAEQEDTVEKHYSSGCWGCNGGYC